MNDADIIARHEPDWIYVGEGMDGEGIECLYCSPRELLVHPLATWTEFAEHLAAALEENRP